MRLTWLDQALLRAEETRRYIAADNPAAARRWVSGLFEVGEDGLPT